jgi:hypothetical protein
MSYPRALARQNLPGRSCRKEHPVMPTATRQNCDIIEIAKLFALARFLQR